MLNIPDDKLPTEWKDEARINSLFSPFRSRTVNSKDWDTKIASWKNIISLYCVNNSVYSFTLSLLNKVFIRNGRLPSCLNVVVEELVKNGELQHFEDFMKESPQTWSGWAADLLVRKPISWSYNSLRRSLFTPKVNPEQLYVHLDVIQTESQKLFSSIPESSRNKVINFSQLLKITGRDINQAKDIQLLLHQLVSEEKISVSKLQSPTGDQFDSFLIKFGEIKATPISEIELSGYVLEQDAILFQKHVEELEDEINKILCQAKAQLAKGHRQSAKTLLRRKREVEKRLAKKSDALCNIHSLLERVKDAHTDGKVLESYKLALNAFNTTFKEKGLNEDAVEDTMNQVAEVLDIHEDIQNALSRPIQEVDEDLEAELDELMKTNDDHNNPGDNNDDSAEDLDDMLTKLNLDKLPKVPNTEIDVKEASFL